jgi:hypothetical protein
VGAGPSSGTTQPIPPQDYTNQWQQLIQTFRNQPAPDSCTLLAADYLTLLTDSELAASQDAASTSTLADDATRADDELTKVSVNARVEKPFNIAGPGSTPTQ